MILEETWEASHNRIRVEIARKDVLALYRKAQEQRQLVTLVAKGMNNKEIAVQLNLSEFTVRNHIHRIMKQVDVGSRREAVRVVRDESLWAIS